MTARLTLPTLIICLLLIFGGRIDAQPPGQTADGQESALTKAAQAVVRVEACTGTTCRAGSGAIIDPSGIILTAWHVTAVSTQTLDSPLFANFNIQMIDDIALPPETRYQAQVIASKPDQDLALLRITYDVNEGRTVTLGTDLGLPWLPLSAQTPQEGQLRIMGYPSAGEGTISYAGLELNGLAERGALLKVQGTLSEGYSGGPAMMAVDGGTYEVVGLVIKRRGSLGELGFIRNIHQLTGLTWQRTAQQVWGEKIQVQAGPSTADGMEIIQVRFDLRALDLVDSPVQVRVLLFEAATNHPWQPAESMLPRNENGQVYLWKRLKPQRFLEIQNSLALEVHAEELGIPPEQLKLQLMIWDEQKGRILWQTPIAYAPKRVSQIVGTEGDLPQATQTAPAPGLTTTTTTLTDTVATSIAATLTPTLTPTDTPDFSKLLETAVAATLTAQPSDTPAAMATPSRTPTSLSQPATAVIIRQANVRQGPGTNYVVIGTAAQGQRFTIMGKNPDGSWWQIDYNGQIGWIAGQLANVQDAGAVEIVQQIRTPAATHTPTPGADRISATVTPTGIAVKSCTITGAFAPVWPEYQVQLGCNVTVVQEGVITVEAFQSGYLLWIKAEDRIYALLDNGRRWSSYPNRWSSGEDALPCADAQRYGYPAMGFGYLWCNDPVVKQSLGTPLDKERADERALRQVFESGQIVQVQGNRIFVLFENGAGWLVR